IPWELLALALPALLLGHLASLTLTFATTRPSTESIPLIRYTDEIRMNTPPNAVVGSPILNMEVPYYSERHIVRGIQNDDLVALLYNRAPAEFPKSPVLIAVPK